MPKTNTMDEMKLVLRDANEYARGSTFWSLCCIRQYYPITL